MSATDPILTLDNVSKRFGGLAVVENLSFSVRRGACAGLIGPNGAGKTTVFNLITGVYPIDAGRIMLDGLDIAKISSRRRIHHGVARNFQNIRLMPHSALWKTCWWASIAERRVFWRASAGQPRAGQSLA